MNILFFFAHLAAVLLAALAVWSMRHELGETAVGRREWLLAPALAASAAVVLLVVSPGKRLEFWSMAIAVGFAIGLLAGLLPTAVKDFALDLVRIKRRWDGLIAVTLVFLLALSRFVSTELLGRRSGGYGVLGAAAAFLAAYLIGRVVTLLFYNAPRTIHLDMIRGRSER